ncbi:hypothetical protein G3N57_11020 [Paraburkholderia sp. Se-20369]|nr:hypothetical protein [Paraburkholderia sp. Se-20369]
MSHAIDLLSLREKLFVLQHISHGSEKYCQDVGLVVEDDLYDRNFDPNYKTVWADTKVLVSNYLIECAVKLRMLQEFCEKSDDRSKIAALGKQAVGDLPIGRVLDGSFQLSIREASNKIIHATSCDLYFKESQAAVIYWQGTCNLKGSLGKESWHLELHVANWGLAVQRYLDILGENGMLDYLGQDYA